MSSRVLKGPEAGRAARFPWPAGHDKNGEVRPFVPRRLDADPESPPAETAAEPTPDLEAVRRQAFQEGLAAGREAAEKRFGDELRAKAERLGRVIDEIAGYKSALRAEAEAELVELAFAIARRILRRELTVDPAAARALVASCLREYPNAGVRRVFVHPDDAASVREAVGAAEVVGDEATPRGGAVLETDRGRIDARIETQLEEIAFGLADA